MPRDHTRDAKPWTAEEDAALLTLQGAHGNRWSEIARAMGTRSGQQCAQRWRHKVNPGIRRERWSEEEDEKLKTLKERYGSRWATIAREMGGRTDQQCMGRWRRHLDPTVTRGAWARDEDELLCGLYDEYGPRWSFICQSVPGRTAQQCRARWFQVDGKPREERDYRPSRRQSPVETSSHGPAEDHPARRFSDHEGLVTRTSIDSMPMASLSPTPVAEKRPFSHILAEVSARTTQKTGSLIESASIATALGRASPATLSKRKQVSTALDPMSLWRDVGGTKAVGSLAPTLVEDGKRKRGRPSKTVDAPRSPMARLSVQSPRASSVYAPRTRARASTASASSKSTPHSSVIGRSTEEDKLSVLLGVALGRSDGAAPR